jgi:hypothetical protein
MGGTANSVHLGNTDELGPLDIRLVGSWSPLISENPGDVVVSTDGEVMYILDVYSDAAIARRHKCRTRHLGRYNGTQLTTPNFNHIMSDPIDRESRGARARNDVITMARSNSLSLFVSLDYEDQPDGRNEYPSGCDEMFGLFLRRLRRSVGPFPWIEVLEIGDVNNRLHHHVLMSDKTDEALIDDKWSFGHSDVKRLNNLDSIGSCAFYMTKTFEKPEVERPRRARYRVARCIYREQPIRLIGSRDEIENEIRRLVPQGVHLKEWHSEHPFSHGGYTWDRPV